MLLGEHTEGRLPSLPLTLCEETLPGFAHNLDYRIEVMRITIVSALVGIILSRYSRHMILLLHAGYNKVAILQHEYNLRQGANRSHPCKHGNPAVPLVDGGARWLAPQSQV
jgi:hypothetical protein